MPRGRTRPGRRSAPYNPFAPVRPAALAQMARSDVNAQVLPLIAQINNEFNRRATSGQQSIQGYTSALASALAPAAAQTQANYGVAQDAQRTENAALASYLEHIGQQSGGELGAKLQAAGLGAVPNNAAQIGGGAAIASRATGGSALSRLLSQGAAAQEYSGQLPNIAQLGGAQRSRQFGAQIESQRATQTGDIRSRIPGLVQNALGSLRAQEFQKAVATQSGLVDTAKLNLDTAYKKAKLSQGDQSLSLRQQQIDASTQAALDRINISQGQLDLARQREQRLRKGKAGKTGGFTASQVSKFRATAIDTVKDWKHGVPAVTDASGNVKSKAINPNPDPRSAFRYLVLHGVPPSIADWAVGSVYGKWKAPGQGTKRGPTGTGPR